MENNRHIASLASRFREVLLDGKWIANTNFRQELDGLDWQVAVAQIGQCNTIALLAQHVHYYIAGILQVMQGGTLDIRDQYSFDFAPILSQSAWDTFLDQLWQDAGAFADFVDAMTSQQLEDGFVMEQYGTWERNIDAMIEHAYYHLGQIVLLKRLQQHK